MKWLVISADSRFLTNAQSLLHEAGQEVFVEANPGVFHVGRAAQRGDYVGSQIVIIDCGSIPRGMRSLMIHGMRESLIRALPELFVYLSRSGWVSPDVINLFRSYNKELGKETCWVIERPLTKKIIDFIILTINKEISL